MIRAFRTGLRKPVLLLNVFNVELRVGLLRTEGMMSRVGARGVVQKESASGVGSRPGSMLVVGATRDGRRGGKAALYPHRCTQR